MARRASGRVVAAVACLVLGTGLLGGAAAGAWLTGGEERAARTAFDNARELWRDMPVDELFPTEIDGAGVGPGGADRRWIRVAVAPDGACADGLDPLLAEVLSGVGCHRLVRATYTDETQTTVTTVGLLFAEADSAGMDTLARRFADEELAGRTDLLPRTFAAPGTAADDFGDAQRASWSVRVLTELPVVVYAVSGFADGRAISDPEPAAEATADGQDSTIALAGLGHDAAGIADRIEAGLREAAESRTQEAR
ncbi:hypothetical protein E1283_35285 [Streptomyces hainanensis]|uniref:Uncharacterized protein n=1 Tax=Streptomyces hainanensis TaxID=402648 RepID=A0A4V2XZM7_9ACTN|nr:hypothetical protein E1283_35285 [Streptomyces hainanensis]